MSKPVLTLEASGKHTRGPWRAMAGDELVFVERPNIAHVGVTGGKAYKAPFVIVGNPGPKGSEEADAHLIAAAPDLLEAMKGIEHFSDAVAFRDDPLSKALREWIEAGRSAIAKAESASRLRAVSQP